MHPLDPMSEFSKQMSATEVFIGFTPLHDEVTYAEEDSPFPSLDQKEHYRIMPDTYSDPFTEACSLRKKYSTRSVCVIVPGQLFDIYGNRHGRGGGWYDRFLHAAPSHWLRIGVTDFQRFSFHRIPRAAHDQPVDRVLLKGFTDWFVCQADRTQVRHTPLYKYRPQVGKRDPFLADLPHLDLW